MSRPTDTTDWQTDHFDRYLDVYEVILIVAVFGRKTLIQIL